MYDHKNIDKKWQDRWAESKIFEAQDESDKEKFYLLIEFPYPSGAGLHIGHPRSYTALDVIARKRRAEGYNVLYPIGWDAFGLPTENYAIKTGRPPQEVTKENVDTFRRQLQSLGISFDWSREINTTDPAYYKWTQWQFLQFFKAGLAYKANLPINWCLSCKIGLANEEVVDGKCERCGGEVEKRDKEQWMIAITKYADRLLEDLDTVDYLEKIKKQQVDWIGKSKGAEVIFKIADHDEDLKVFTTRPDTLFGATYMVLAPEHPLVSAITTKDQKAAVEKYVKEAKSKTDIERGDVEKEKTGEFTGAYAINPVNNEKIPIWVADYVMMGYGTGAIMAVPAHDVRDFDFAKKYEIPIKPVVKPVNEEYLFKYIDYASTGKTDEKSILRNKQRLTELYQQVLKGEFCFPGDGIAVNSGEFDTLPTAEVKKKITVWLEKKGIGKSAVNYKLRDWVFSRQRYWGEPIPLVNCPKCGWVAIPDDQLPVELPKVEKYEPTDSGESPLAAIEDWVNTTCPKCGGAARRETDTMPNWAGSSWYFLRYCDPHNDQTFASADKLKYWMPVDWYNGGMEHTTLHLLYSRFWNKFLFDQGHVPTAEPYQKRTSHGLVLAADGTKMSKSKGNVVNPDEIVEKFGADTLRVYEMFLGPFGEPVPWSENGVIGVRRFLDRMTDYVEKWIEAEKEDRLQGDQPAIEKAIKKVGEDVEKMRFNTAIAALMSCLKELRGDTAFPEQENYEMRFVSRKQLIRFLQVLNPFAPHVANELHQMLGQDQLLEELPWPEFDEELARESEVEIAVQVNGKLRGTITVAAGTSESEVVELARAQGNVAKHLGDEPKKTIFVADKLVNFVI